MKKIGIFAVLMAGLAFNSYGTGGIKTPSNLVCVGDNTIQVLVDDKDKPQPCKIKYSIRAGNGSTSKGVMVGTDCAEAADKIQKIAAIL